MFKNQAKLIEVVRLRVNEYDPENLLKCGCPQNEYDPEIKDIADSLMPRATVMEVWLIICNVLAWHFRPHDEPVLYWRKHMDLAECIVEALPTIDDQETR